MSPLSIALWTSNVPPRLGFRTTVIPVRASMCCASNSARMTCSVKNLELTTNCGFRGWRQAERANAASRRRQNGERFISDDPQTALEKAEQKIGEEREQRCGNRSGKNYGVADHGNSAKNESAEAASSDFRGDGGHADSDHGGGADSSKNDAGGQGQPHAK